MVSPVFELFQRGHSRVLGGRCSSYCLAASAALEGEKDSVKNANVVYGVQPNRSLLHIQESHSALIPSTSIPLTMFPTHGTLLI